MPNNPPLVSLCHLNQYDLSDTNKIYAHIDTDYRNHKSYTCTVT